MRSLARGEQRSLPESVYALGETKFKTSVGKGEISLKWLTVLSVGRGSEAKVKKKATASTKCVPFLII